ncbi:stage 0 sporulation regulatory protein [Neobacillus niacini]|jgi:stage 0 sporulation regulatory protein|uniref:aspartyl-phosphate phosphatase Spo0E family protein n=1 Tax=Neobacillus niacini TaxID=86668 RepID=UPI00277D8F4A|nr:aspartyl-phosphate phosphatase Spo0E family protein [Neobacillus niacini]MDQ1003998.1 stage 0 sporulation regulatory protein [Neobacillus niacini]
MDSNNPSEMLDAIKVKRAMMINCANKKGFTSEETIKYSQELDVLINEYQKASQQFPRPNEEVKFAFNQMIMIWPKIFV